MSVVPPKGKVITYDVFVGNLPSDADQRKVGKIFSKFGEVHNIWVNTSSDGGRFGLVKFFCEQDALKAIEEVNGTTFEGGNKLLVKKAAKRGAPVHRKEGETEETGEKYEEGKLQTILMKQRNPDIVPSFESNTGQQMKRETEKILISHVETPIMMWGQKTSLDNINELTSISEQLAIICPEAPKLSGKPEQEKVYGAQYSVDECWYRCVVRYTFSSERVKVQYIDFGNTEELDPSTLVELPKSLTALPPCAIKYMLHSLWSNNNQDANALKFLREIAEGKEADVFTTARLSDHTGFFAEIFIAGVSINEKMLESGFAFKKPGLEQRGLKPRPLGASGDGGATNNVKVAFPNIRDGPRKFDTEKDEISNLRWKLKNLQTEYASLSNKAQENDLSSQIKNLQALTSMVRKLRNQFPLDKETPLDTALVLVQSAGKIGIHMAQSIPEVCKSISAYKSAQDEIRKCSDSSILKEKTEARNLQKKELFDRLTVAIEELNKVPLLDRGKQVQDIVSALTKHYDAFTKFTVPHLPLIESLLPSFEEWKIKKKGDIVGARRYSDTMESSVNSVLEKLKSSISLNLELEDDDMSDDLDGTLKLYAKALQQEISVADTENSPDAIFIATLVQALLNDLREESSCVDHLSNVLHEFTSLKDQIAPWLDSTPSINELQSVRSKIKNMKSKLRHKLADKVDAEENQESQELEEIAKDLENIRNNIHKALKEEDKLLADLSELASAHFPELINGESDAGFATYLAYKGLVKLSHAPDQYTMTPVGSNLSGMFVSQLDSEPVYIKEYFLGSASKLSKEEFLSQMALYSNASSLYLEPVYAVFFDKDNRHAFVEIKKRGELLSTLVEAAPLTKQQCQSIVKSLCIALQGLHLFNFVHGQIQPEYIVVDGDGTARLLPPDFSMTDAERCRSRYTTSSGVELTAPEIKLNKMSAEPSHSLDVYCLGLLALWMHHPSISFSETRDGTVDFSSLPLDRNLGIFLMKVMHPNPVLRPTAENCLRSEYLCMPVASENQSQSATGYGDSKFGQEPSYGRNSASPASVLSQNSNDGLVYAESGAGIQMIANTRVPPPPIAMDNSSPAANTFNPSLPPSLQHPGPSVSTAQQQQMLQLQQQQLQQQLHQQQIQQQQQYQLQQLQQQYVQQQQADEQQHSSNNSYEPNVSQMPADDNGAFEIGTFDPNAYEVVTSPQPLSAMRADEDVLEENGDKAQTVCVNSEPGSGETNENKEEKTEDDLQDTEDNDKGVEEDN